MNDIDPLYFTPGEFFKGLRLLYNDMDFAMFKREFFPTITKHGDAFGDDYTIGLFRRFGESPFKFWCSLDDEKRERLEFLIYECAKKEAQREGAVA